MASNATTYKNLTPAPDLDQKTLNKMAWRSCFLQASFNYERMQAAGWLYSILPGPVSYTHLAGSAAGEGAACGACACGFGVWAASWKLFSSFTGASRGWAVESRIPA